MYTLSYRPDPISPFGDDGKPFLGTRRMSLFGHSYEELDYKELRLKIPALSNGDIDLSGYCTESNQLSLGSCAGNSTTDSVEVVARISETDLAASEGRAPLPIPEMSRLFTYSMARMLQDDDGDGKNDLNVDDGTYVRLCFDVLSRFGVCREETWPYDVRKVFVSPSMKAMREAVGHRIHSYYRIRATDSGRIDEVVSALRAHHPVVFGTKVDQSFMSVNSATPVGPPQGATVGGHSMAIVGYLGGNFLVKNSWGKGWGTGGFWYMTPEYLTWGQTGDLWVPTMATTFR